MRPITALAVLLLLSGCGLLYRTPVVQGNVIPLDKVAQLRQGMTRDQVRYLLGAPLVNPEFERERMNYVFYYRNPRGHVRKSKLVLYFNDAGRLASISGDEEYTNRVDNAGPSPNGSNSALGG